METKICSFCGEEKNINQYRKSGKYFRGECKKCEAIKHKQYCKTHKHIIKAISHRQYLKNKEYYHLKNISNPEQRKQYNKLYYEKNINYYKEHHKKYSLEHRNILNQKQNEWRKNNPEKVQQIYKKETLKIKSNPIKCFKLEIRNNIRQSFERKNYIKNKHLNEICGCEINELVDYLIKTYEINYNEKWNWDNLGKIHIDHIKPLKYAETKEDVIRLCHYTNLQLLKATDNLKKGYKL